jgi:hypothetical protein
MSRVNATQFHVMGLKRSILAGDWKWLGKRSDWMWPSVRRKERWPFIAFLPVEGHSSFWRVVADAG